MSWSRTKDDGKDYYYCCTSFQMLSVFDKDNVQKLMQPFEDSSLLTADAPSLELKASQKALSDVCESDVCEY